MIYFISGHLTLTEAEFGEQYQPVIEDSLSRGDSFVVGDASGADAMAQNYLLGKTDSVVVCHMFTSPRNNAAFQTIGGFSTDEKRDAQMTADSDCYIAWGRPGCERSAEVNLRLSRRGHGVYSHELVKGARSA